MIRIENLSVRFGRTTAVDGVSLTVPQGGSVALWGTNGAGKTTILRCVLGLLRYQGQVHIGHLDVRRDGKQARCLIGYVPQELGFNDDFRVGEAVAFFARLRGARIDSIDSVLDRVGLRGHDGKRMRELSGGMKQRLALAIALLGDPPILVLDEVTASLDACGREELVALLQSLSRAGKSVLFASHRIEEVNALAQRVVVLAGGRLVREGPAGNLSAAPAPEQVLHLHIKAAARDRAMLLLRSEGFAPSINGVGLLIPVTPATKASPFRVLAEGRVTIDDFDFGPGAAGSAHVRREVYP
jgi:ABC-type multidrug transport system ATPase subunit